MSDKDRYLVNTNSSYIFKLIKTINWLQQVILIRNTFFLYNRVNTRPIPDSHISAGED